MKNKRIIKRNFEFQEIIAKQNTFGNQSFVIYVDESNTDYLKYGISVGKKIGNAVIRNKIKRQIRMMMSNLILIHGCKTKKIIIIAKKSFLDKEFEENNLNLEKIISKIK